MLELASWSVETVDCANRLHLCIVRIYIEEAFISISSSDTHAHTHS